MIVLRDGTSLVVCDECYRPRRVGEIGWVVKSKELVSPETNAIVDRCPECAKSVAMASND